MFKLFGEKDRWGWLPRRWRYWLVRFKGLCRSTFRWLRVLRSRVGLFFGKVREWPKNEQRIWGMRTVEKEIWAAVAAKEKFYEFDERLDRAVLFSAFKWQQSRLSKAIIRARGLAHIYDMHPGVSTEKLEQMLKEYLEQPLPTAAELFGDMKGALAKMVTGAW